MDNTIKSCRCPNCLHGGKIDIATDEYVTTYRNRYYHKDCYKLERSAKTQKERKDREQQSRLEWNRKHTKTYTVNLHQDKDKRIIEYIESEREHTGKSFGQIIRDLFDDYIF